MDKKHHCRPVSREPFAAQTTLQVKLDSYLTILQNSSGIVTNLFSFITSAVNSLGGTIVGIAEEATLSFRQIPWKT